MMLQASRSTVAFLATQMDALLASICTPPAKDREKRLRASRPAAPVRDASARCAHLGASFVRACSQMADVNCTAGLPFAPSDTFPSFFSGRRLLETLKTCTCARS